MQHIETVVVPSGGAASITFSAIPDTFTDLYVVFSLRSTRTGFPVANLQVSINGTSTNENFRFLRGRTPNTVESGSASSAFVFGHIPSADNTASTFGNIGVYIPNYASNVAKSMSADSVSPTNNTADYSAMLEITALLWNDTAAITSISVNPDAGNFAQYSSASLYGILAGSDGVTTVS